MPKLPTPMHKFFADKDGRLVLWQRPNVPLAIWIVFTVLSHLLHPGNLRNTSQLISHAAIIVWAGLEVISGVSYFRRTLGAIVLVLTITAAFR